jgi:hypothetical protein
VKKESGKFKMAELARLEHEIAELDARRAALQARKAGIFSELAEGESVDLRTMRKSRTVRQPQLAPVSELDKARATSALQQLGLRQRLGR